MPENLPTFIRFIKKKEDKEVLINLASIWKIEAEYAVKQGRAGFKIGLIQGMEDPNAFRVYQVFFGNESVLVAQEEDSPAFKLIETLYKNSIKGRDKPPDEPPKA